MEPKHFKEKVAIFLNDHPEFFNFYPDLLKKIQSIEESLAKQTKRLNEKIVQLEESFAKINEQPKGREPDLTKLRGKELYLWVSEEKYIVVNYEELVDSLGKGNLTLDSFIYHNEMEDWTALKNI